MGWATLTAMVLLGDSFRRQFLTALLAGALWALILVGGGIACEACFPVLPILWVVGGIWMFVWTAFRLSAWTSSDEELQFAGLLGLIFLGFPMILGAALVAWVVGIVGWSRSMREYAGGRSGAGVPRRPDAR